MPPTGLLPKIKQNINIYLNEHIIQLTRYLCLPTWDAFRDLVSLVRFKNFSKGVFHVFEL